MDRLLIAFDVDDTLIVPAIATGLDRDVPNYETIAVYRWFQAQGHEMVVWSGGGADYAAMWGRTLGLAADHYLDKHSALLGELADRRVDLTFDDSDLTLGTTNVKVKRLNNGIVRYPDRVSRRPIGTPRPGALRRGTGERVTR